MTDEITQRGMIVRLRQASQVFRPDDVSLSLTPEFCGKIADEMVRLIEAEKQPRASGEVHHHYHLAPNHVVERQGESMLITPAPEKREEKPE